jgi:diguanylate cyclase (GGDEF)-like protein/PAS domain S-box-containing protein
LQEIAPTAGFFTYGEFFHKQLMNQTMTVVAMRESEKKPEEIPRTFNMENTAYHSVNALIHLLNVTSKEVMDQKIFSQSYERFAQLFEHSDDGLIVLKERRLIECNAKALSMFGFGKDEKAVFLQQSLDDLLFSIDEIREMVENMRREAQRSLLFNIECRTKEGGSFWAEVMLTRISSGSDTHYYIVLRDISERIEMEKKLQKQHAQLYAKAYEDDLTGLPNRKSLMETLEKEMVHAKTHQEELALLFIDLDKLKVINDSLGHLAGDKLIQIVAKRLKQVVKLSTMVARLGGDEFLILMRHTTKEQILSQLDKLLRVTREEITFDTHHLYISASIGVAQFPQDATDAYNLLKYADAAMYEAKEKGGNQYYFYNQALTQKAYAQIRIAKEFRRGIKNREFVVFYQPQVEIASGRIIGMEALIRWNHPTEGFSSPGHFLSSIEKANLLQRLDRWVMNQAMKEMVQWHREGLNPGKLSLNVRMSELESQDWEEKLLKTMNRIGFQPSWLEVEITETEIMKQPERVVTLIHTLHKHGISVAIDDFGTGYSSLAQLKYLPFDKLKIDKVFVDDLPQNKDACVLFEMMMTLANNLNVPVLAEGMESEGQVAYLKEVGCHYAQGYYYARPMDAKSIRKRLESQA